MDEIYFLVERVLCHGKTHDYARSHDLLVIVRLEGHEFRGEYPRASAKARQKAIAYLKKCGFGRGEARRYLRFVRKNYEWRDVTE